MDGGAPTWSRIPIESPALSVSALTRATPSSPHAVKKANKNRISNREFLNDDKAAVRVSRVLLCTTHRIRKTRLMPMGKRDQDIAKNKSSSSCFIRARWRCLCLWRQIRSGKTHRRIADASRDITAVFYLKRNSVPFQNSSLTELSGW